MVVNTLLLPDGFDCFASHTVKLVLLEYCLGCGNTNVEENKYSVGSSTHSS